MLLLQIACRNSDRWMRIDATVNDNRKGRAER